MNMGDISEDLLWMRFGQLGEMIGDGLHYEEPWILREYKRLEKRLLPETKEEKARKRKIKQSRNKKLDEQIAERLKYDKCTCGSILKQARSGGVVVSCVRCGARYKYKTSRV